MAFHVVEEIRKKSREDWLKLCHSKVVNGRIWIQENGEAAFVLGLALGFLIVFFHKFVIFLVAVAVIVGSLGYQMSLPAAELERRKGESPDSSFSGVDEPATSVSSVKGNGSNGLAVDPNEDSVKRSNRL